LRVAFGIALRQAVASDPTRFDRVQILVDTIDPIQLAAQRVLSAFGAPPQR
jgi:fructose-bisphosphate aldolase class II